MKKSLIITAIIALTATLSSCKEEHRTGPNPIDFYKIINESGHKLTIVNNSDPIYEYYFPERLELENDDSYEWKHIDHSSHSPINVFFSEGDRLECYFDDEYVIVFMGNAYHEYNIANTTPYERKNLGDSKNSYTCVITEEMYEYAVELNEQGLIFAGSEDPNFVLPPQYEEKSNNGI